MTQLRLSQKGLVAFLTPGAGLFSPALGYQGRTLENHASKIWLELRPLLLELYTEESTREHPVLHHLTRN